MQLWCLIIAQQRCTQFQVRNHCTAAMHAALVFDPQAAATAATRHAIVVIDHRSSVAVHEILVFDHRTAALHAAFCV